jgi:hypothetical protein
LLTTGREQIRLDEGMNENRAGAIDEPVRVAFDLQLADGERMKLSMKLDSVKFQQLTHHQRGWLERMLLRHGGRTTRRIESNEMRGELSSDFE